MGQGEPQVCTVLAFSAQNETAGSSLDLGNETHVSKGISCYQLQTVSARRPQGARVAR